MSQCTYDCMDANHCSGATPCEGCGRMYCPEYLDDDGLCERCHDEAVREREDAEEDGDANNATSPSGDGGPLADWASPA